MSNIYLVFMKLNSRSYLFLDPQHFLYFFFDPQAQRSLGIFVSFWIYWNSHRLISSTLQNFDGFFSSDFGTQHLPANIAAGNVFLKSNCFESRLKRCGISNNIYKEISIFLPSQLFVHIIYYLVILLIIQSMFSPHRRLHFHNLYILFYRNLLLLSTTMVLRTTTISMDTTSTLLLFSI